MLSEKIRKERLPSIVLAMLHYARRGWLDPDITKGVLNYARSEGLATSPIPSPSLEEMRKINRQKAARGRRRSS